MKNNKTLIIAEIGVNHNGNIDIAKSLINSASSAKADYVKFQNFKPTKLASKITKKSNYQKIRTKNKESFLEMLEKYYFNFKKISLLKKYAERKKIKFLCTPFDQETADDLIKLKLKKIKISSGDITDLPLIDYISKKKIHMIVSTGRSTIKEIEEAVKIIKKNKCKFSLLHCVSLYPAPFKELNLNSIQKLKKKFKCDVGFSDHTLGIEASIAAVTLGANIIEKHITFDRNAEGPDHFASLDIKELSYFVSAIRNVENSFGDGIKKPSDGEKKEIHNARKSIISIKNINKESKITKNNVAIKRPEIGLAPIYFNDVIGRKALKKIKANTGIQWSMLSKTIS